MGYLLADHEIVRPYSAVMLGSQPNPVNSLIPQGLQGAVSAPKVTARVIPSLEPRTKFALTYVF